MTNKLEDITLKDLCSCLALLNKLQQEGIIDFDLKTTTATFNTDKATEYLEKQNIELQERINKAIEYGNEKIGFLENCFGGNDIEIRACITIHNEYLKILKGDSNE